LPFGYRGDCFLGLSIKEVSNDDLYQAIEDEANKVANMQRKVFYKLFELGWYILEKSTQTKINKTISKFSKSMQELD
jgi:hypothetical protein